MPITIGRYLIFGITLIIAGSLIGVISYFTVGLSKSSTSLIALGIAIAIVGLASISLPDQVTARDSMKALLRGSSAGIEPILGEIQAVRKSGNKSSHLDENKQADEVKLMRAVYLPPDDQQNSSVYVPLAYGIVATKKEMMIAPTKLLLSNNQSGIRVFTAAANLSLALKVREPDATIEDSLNYLLVDSAELCSGVRVTEIEDIIVVEIENVKLQTESENYRELLGTFPTSIAASAIAVLKSSPILIENEEITPRRTIAQLTTWKDNQVESRKKGGVAMEIKNDEEELVKAN